MNPFQYVGFSDTCSCLIFRCKITLMLVLSNQTNNDPILFAVMGRCRQLVLHLVPHRILLYIHRCPASVYSRIFVFKVSVASDRENREGDLARMSLLFLILWKCMVRAWEQDIEYILTWMAGDHGAPSAPAGIGLTACHSRRLCGACWQEHRRPQFARPAPKGPIPLQQVLDVCRLVCEQNR